MGSKRTQTSREEREVRKEVLAGWSSVKLLEQIGVCAARARARLLEQARTSYDVGALARHSQETHGILLDVVLAVEELQVRSASRRASYEAF